MKSMERYSMKVPGKQERCIICGQVTDMEKDWPVAMRKNYVEGAGQLCRKCYLEIYSDGN